MAKTSAKNDKDKDAAAPAAEETAAQDQAQQPAAEQVELKVNDDDVV